MDTVTRVDLSQLPEENDSEIEQRQAKGDCEPPEIAVLTSGRLLVMPESVYADFPGVKGFAVTREGERIVLTPIKPAKVTLEDIQQHVADLGITEQDVADAVQWARGRR